MSQIDLNSFFQQLTNTESLVLVLLLLGAFLFGTLFGIALRGRKLRRLKKELKKKDKTIAELNDKLKEQEETLAVKEADLKKAAYDLNQVRLAADRYEQEKSDLNKQLFKLRSDLDKNQQSNANLDATMDDLNEQVIGLKARNADLLSQLEKSQQDNNSPKDEAKVKALNQQIAYLQTRNEELQNEIENLKTSDPDSGAARIEALQQQVSYLKSQNGELMERLAQQAETNQHNTTLPKTDKLSGDRLAAFEARLAQLEGENDELKASIDQLSTVKDPLPGDTKTPGSQPDLQAKGEEPDPTVDLNPNVDLFKTDRALLHNPHRDDLTTIDGIGPFIEKKLNDIGITTYEQIASWSDGDIEKVTKEIQYFEGRIVKDNWVGQAKILLETDPDEVSSKGGPKFFKGSNSGDDLKIVEGIGPKIESVLKAAGITTLDALAKADPADLQFLLGQNMADAQLHDPNTWPAQARLAANGDWDVLEDYQENLKNGKDL